MQFKILLQKEPEGAYTAFVPRLPGCITYGETINEAIDMAREAIALYIEEMRSHGEGIPDDSETLEYNLTLEEV